MMLHIPGGEGKMMNAHDLDFETIRPLDLNNGALTPGSQATPFSTLLWAVVSGDLAAVEAQITDDIEWGLMPYNKVLKGKEEVLPWFRAASADQKKPIVITNVATSDWGSLNTGILGP